MASLDATPSLIVRSAVALAAQVAGLPPGVLITLLVVIAAPTVVATVVHATAAGVALFAKDQQRAKRALRILEMYQHHRSRTQRLARRPVREQPNSTES